MTMNPPPERFTFDHIDDFKNDLDDYGDASPRRHPPHTAVAATPTTAAAVPLTPSRLDARYYSRLKSPQHHHHHHSNGNNIYFNNHPSPTTCQYQYQRSNTSSSSNCNSSRNTSRSSSAAASPRGVVVTTSAPTTPSASSILGNNGNNNNNLDEGINQDIASLRRDLFGVTSTTTNNHSHNHDSTAVTTISSSSTAAAAATAPSGLNLPSQSSIHSSSSSSSLLSAIVTGATTSMSASTTTPTTTTAPKRIIGQQHVQHQAPQLNNNYYNRPTISTFITSTPTSASRNDGRRRRRRQASLGYCAYGSGATSTCSSSLHGDGDCGAAAGGGGDDNITTMSISTTSSTTVTTTTTTNNNNNNSNTPTVTTDHTLTNGIPSGEVGMGGDRFIPSRVTSNFNFDLAVRSPSSSFATVRSSSGGTAIVTPNSSLASSGGRSRSSSFRGRGGGRGIAAAGGVGAGSSSSTTTMTMIVDDLYPTPSFGATMMGGGTRTMVDGISTIPPSSQEGGFAAAATTPSSFDDAASIASSSSAADDGMIDRYDASNRHPLLYDALLRSELLGENIDPTMRYHHHHSGSSMPSSSMHSASSPGGGRAMGSPTTAAVNSSGSNSYQMTMSGGGGVLVPYSRERNNNYLRFNHPNSSSRQHYHNSIYGGGSTTTTTTAIDGDVPNINHYSASIVDSFQLSPVSMSPTNPHRGNLYGPYYSEQRKRKIGKAPTKVLDAPALQDDFYLNLVDWSSQNILAVGLGSCVYLWSGTTSRVTQLCDLSTSDDTVTSVAWGGKYLAVGSTRGEIQLWDASAQKCIRTIQGHSARVGALSWKLSGCGGGGGVGGGGGGNSLLASGSRDRQIHLLDPRTDTPALRLRGHRQEVCGLRWSFDDRSMLASGGNDNRLLVWDVKRHTQPVHTFTDHTAAVKAIAWSPHQHGLLASGGGTADRCIRFWNCLTGHGINCVDTGSQVCNLAFSRNCNELVSTHGYSLNQIVVWKYPSMQKIATLTGHTYRVLYLALSPDGSTIVTGAGDETLRFWQVFPGPQKENKAGGLLFPAGMPGSVIR